MSYLMNILNFLKKHWIIPVLVLALAYLIVFVPSRFSAYTTYIPFSGKVFQISADDVDTITFWKYGETIVYTDSEDKAEIVNLLNGFRYWYWMPSLPVGMGGWTYMIDIDGDSKSENYVFGDSWIKVNGLYLYGKTGYFDAILTELDAL